MHRQSRGARPNHDPPAFVRLRVLCHGTSLLTSSWTVRVSSPETSASRTSGVSARDDEAMLHTQKRPGVRPAIRLTARHVMVVSWNELDVCFVSTASRAPHVSFPTRVRTGHCMLDAGDVRLLWRGFYGKSARANIKNGNVYAAQQGGGCLIAAAVLGGGVSANCLHGCERFHRYNLLSCPGPWRVECP
jgi:hypothetical protein